MTITPEAVLQVVQIVILSGIFIRIGAHGASIKSHAHRISNLEGRLWEQMKH